MNNEYQYKVDSCPICLQGYVEIVKEQETGKLFVCCDECEAEWETPEDVKQKKQGTRCKFGKVTEPTYDEICNMNWMEYILTDAK